MVTQSIEDAVWVVEDAMLKSKIRLGKDGILYYTYVDKAEEACCGRSQRGHHTLLNLIEIRIS